MDYVNHQLVSTTPAYDNDYQKASQKTVQRAIKMLNTRRLIVTDGNKCIQSRIRDLEPETDENLHRFDMLTSIMQRYEMKDMPSDGWAINAALWSCDCRIYAKDGSCIHVVAVKYANNVAQPHAVRPRNILVNQRAIRIRRGNSTRGRNVIRGRNAARGRPPGGRGAGNAYDF